MTARALVCGLLALALNQAEAQVVEVCEDRASSGVQDDDDRAGSSVAIKGLRLLVGIPDLDIGAAYFAGAAIAYERRQGRWVGGRVLDFGAADNYMGASVALSDDYALVGAPGAESSGRVYVYAWDEISSDFVLDTILIGSETGPGADFGRSVDICGDTIVVGATNAVGTYASGAAYVFVLQNGAWVEQQKLVPSDGRLWDGFGGAVACSGDTLVVGAYRDDPAGTDSGSAYVFEREAGIWSEQAYLAPSDLAASDEFGLSVDIDVDTIVIGSSKNDHAQTDAGAAYVYIRTGLPGPMPSWVLEQKLTASVPGNEDWFGLSVRIDGERVICGSSQNDEPLPDAGSAYVFERRSGIWYELAELHAFDAFEQDHFGEAVAIDGLRCAVGAPDEDTRGDSSGSVYIFRVVQGAPGVAVCFGDGTSRPCPCDNESPTPGEGCLHTSGYGMTVSGSGSVSIAADDLTVIAGNCPPGNTGLFYCGTIWLAGGQSFGQWDGLQCVSGEVRRFQGVFQDNGVASDTGFVAQDPSGIYFNAGASYYFQYWSRDVAAGMSPCYWNANFSPLYAVTMSP